ncbi:MAG: polysaccharide deacetylase family protein [Chloroflexi bacterium]|nr:polysaccharide deacetylase family protein [Chloroflexota bacterium]
MNAMSNDRTLRQAPGERSPGERRDGRWNGRPFAFVLRVDVEHREAERYTGDPRTERVATVALLDLLAEIDLRASCAVLGITAEHYPDIVRRITEAGHDVLGHSMFHEPAYSALSLADQRWDHRRSREAIEDACGVTIKGIAAHYHGLTNDETYAAAALEGLDYLLGRRPEGLPEDALGFAPYRTAGCDRPILAPAGGRLGASDWSARRREWPWIEEPWSADGARIEWRRRIDRAAETGALFSLVVHPWMLHINEGEWSVVRDVVAHARTRGAWLTTFGELAAMAKNG